jgi:hypothetical protein
VRLMPFPSPADLVTPANASTKAAYHLNHMSAILPKNVLATSNVAPMRIANTEAISRISNSAISTLFIPIRVPQQNLPDAGTQNGNLFLDRFDSTLHWYTPHFALAEAPDPVFSFAATQTKDLDNLGNPFNKAQLTLGLKKIVPDDVAAFRAANPTAKLEEVALSNFAVTLTCTSKDPETGADVAKSYSVNVTVAGDGSLQLTLDNLQGIAVLLLYSNLRNGGASLSLITNYQVWQVVGSVRIPPIRRRPPFILQPPPHSTTPPTRILSATNLAMTSASVARRNLDLTVVATPVASPVTVSHFPANTVSISFNDSPVPPVAPSIAPPPPPNYQRATATLTFTMPLGTAYHADCYSLLFTISDGTTSRPILNTGDLRDYNQKQSEFTEMKALGDISTRYRSLSRCYLGVLSKTVVVIASRYSLVRSTQGIPAKCEALVDSAASGTSKCKFDFMFLLAPDASPIDLIQLSQEISNRPELKGYTVTLPVFLKEGTSPKLIGGFQNSCFGSTTPMQHTFAITVEVQDQSDTAPAVASANLLIRQLCTDAQPFLFGTMSLKLDDYYSQPVEANFVLNFHETCASDELTFTVDEGAQTIILLNHSPFDLVVTRCGLCNASGISIVPVNQAIPAGGSISLPLPADHIQLNVLADRELVAPGVISKQDIGKFMLFQTQDVQNTQYALGINASDVDFQGRGIGTLTVNITLDALSDIRVPEFTLVNLRKVNSVNVLIPLQNAISSLLATVLFTIHYTDPQKTDARFTRTHEFLDDPVMLVANGDLPS